MIIESSWLVQLRGFPRVVWFTRRTLLIVEERPPGVVTVTFFNIGFSMPCRGSPVVVTKVTVPSGATVVVVPFVLIVVSVVNPLGLVFTC
jgi:hypothetical protein